MNQADRSPKILVAPLDWGLGHATRCIPIIRSLLLQNCEVIVAVSGKGKAVLQEEFPQLCFLHLPGYNIEYASSAWGLAVKIVAQIPKLLSAIKEEENWLKRIVEEEEIDAVISDNRYGLHHPDVRSVFITHQLRIQTPFGFAEELLQELNYQYINQFHECWVPDARGENNLAGDLSHPAELPTIPLHYTGLLSRFGNNGSPFGERHVLILLSGPEPQRTLLEEKIVAEIKDCTKPVVLVRGLPDITAPLELSLNGVIYNHLPAAALEQLIAEASIVIARCGYSTVMDLAALQKRSILIPTPGQTEQEYLAGHLMQKNLALCVEQRKFRLKHALALAENYSYQLNFPAEDNLSSVIAAFVKEVRSAKAKAAESVV